MTSEIELNTQKTLEKNNKPEEEETGNFRGTMGPLEDEIHIRKFYDKHRNTPVFNGAFKNVKNKNILLTIFI